MNEAATMYGLFHDRSDELALQDGVLFGQGWHHNGTATLWSRRLKSELVLLEECFGTTERIDMQIQSFGATDDRPQYLSVDCDGAQSETFVISSDLPVQIPIKCPRFSNGRGKLILTTEWLDSPYCLSGSPDDRLLGVRPIQLIQSETGRFEGLNFSDREICKKHAQNGWSLPDFDGVWQQEEVAFIDFYQSELAEVDALTLSFMVINQPSNPLSVSLSHPEFAETYGEFSGEGLHSLQLARVKKDEKHDVDRVLLIEETVQQLTISASGRVSPKALGTNEDERELGVKLVSIEVI